MSELEKHGFEHSYVKYTQYFFSNVNKQVPNEELDSYYQSEDISVLFIQKKKEEGKKRTNIVEDEPPKKSNKKSKP